MYRNDIMFIWLLGSERVLVASARAFLCSQAFNLFLFHYISSGMRTLYFSPLHTLVYHSQSQAYFIIKHE